MPSIENFFEITRGSSGLTEEFIYNYYGKIPVISASSDKFFIFGYVDEKRIKEDIIDFPVILIVRVGKAGVTQFLNLPKFVVTENVLVLYPKVEYRNEFNFKWLEYILRPLLTRNARGDIKGQRNISAEIIYRLKFNKKSLSYQKEVSELLKKAEKLYNKINNLLQFLPNIEVKFEDMKGEYVKLSKIFRFIGGNSGLTEEFIYYNQPINDNDKIPILSGATLKANLMGYVSRNAKPQGKKLKTFKGSCILVARNGYAGKMTYIPKGEFTTNDHAYVLIPKKEWKDKINLRWFVYQYQELFYNLVTSKSDNATFNKKYAQKQKIKIPDISVQNIIAEKLFKIDMIIEKLETLKKDINDLMEYEIISSTSAESGQEL